ncbi:sugar ABC transporter permease [Caproiciproducens galactitolivorans]|uniref:Lactose transport system permease protein LacF n=1 Tax=Caproiciproducens galactitolivorans TaxID=642589 RepID=A0A4Z0Y8H0_9FIRM|nr:sugar ABC transporter permease [Caproiciproducens galactitolivorans]QEY34863.1 sugar ABC transporter permease [Caproiciproducens galactitolivorans]TGJ75571.1 lactose transport system permease protein LacF [Caproiciproducens galactitolivorans]
MPGLSHGVKKRKSVSYAKWGYFFIAPFFLVFAVFSLVPLLSTFYNSFFENYMVGLLHIGPKFVGLENYKTIFLNGDMPKYMGNTVILWLMCFIPQVVFSLLLAAWFTNASLRIKGQGFFKTVIYLPNLIMATAFSMLFYAMFSDSGPVNSILMSMGMENPYRFLANIGSTRGLIALMNFLMWFGNTTILLMAAMLGVDPGLFEAAEIDGATSSQIFFKITLPLIKPILTYVFITSMIGGLQMFDVPQILTNGNGNPSRSSMTLVMYLNKHLFSKNYGLGGAVSVILFFLCAALSALVYRSLTGRMERGQA